MLRRGLNLTKAVVRHVADGAKVVSDDEYRIRLETCDTCDRRRPEDSMCLECGCYLKIKAKWRSEDCPLKKWPALEGQKDKGADAPPPKRLCCGG